MSYVITSPMIFTEDKCGAKSYEEQTAHSVSNSERRTSVQFLYRTRKIFVICI